MDSPPEARRRELLGALLCAGLAGCGDGSGDSGPPPVATRGWRMGFSPNPPRPDVATALRGINLWSTRGRCNPEATGTRRSGPGPSPQRRSS